MAGGMTIPINYGCPEQPATRAPNPFFHLAVLLLRKQRRDETQSRLSFLSSEEL